MGPNLSPTWAPRGPPKRPKSAFDIGLGTPLFGFDVGKPWKIDLGTIWGPSWGHLGPILGVSGANLGPSWAILGPSWGHLGAVLGHLGAIFGPTWSFFLCVALCRNNPHRDHRASDANMQRTRPPETDAAVGRKEAQGTQVPPSKPADLRQPTWLLFNNSTANS